MEALRVTAIAVTHGHAEPALAYRFDTAEGSVVFSGDTTVNSDLIALAREADILVHCVADLGYLERHGNDKEPSRADGRVAHRRHRGWRRGRASRRKEAHPHPLPAGRAGRHRRGGRAGAPRPASGGRPLRDTTACAELSPALPRDRLKDRRQQRGARGHRSRTLCSTVSMTSSILPLSTCLAMLSVKPLAVAAGTWEGRESA